MRSGLGTVRRDFARAARRAGGALYRLLCGHAAQDVVCTALAALRITAVRLVDPGVVGPKHEAHEFLRGVHEPAH